MASNGLLQSLHRTQAAIHSGRKDEALKALADAREAAEIQANYIAVLEGRAIDEERLTAELAKVTGNDPRLEVKERAKR